MSITIYVYFKPLGVLESNESDPSEPGVRGKLGTGGQGKEVWERVRGEDEAR